ncbi:hypothetical protein SteCoe_15250 [Stentor coeruleus]|uniref:SAM domain-containing protein n=1 Tax=Stentor coeruleus TaxID=5963 RepID=A0A1R2C476_9CILI|nr:hypothetical protein SteCoe_15250 [Stentor coeruleus]
MSASRITTKPRNRTAPHNPSPSSFGSNIHSFKQHINQIAINMRSPLKLSNFSNTPDLHSKQSKVRTPSLPKSSEPENIEEFLSVNGFENYIISFKENQLSLKDLPYLTKEDLTDMKIPIGPRNRLMKIIEGMENREETRSNYEPRRENISQSEISPKRVGIRDEVDKFMSELSQFSKRSEPKIRPSSRDQSLESFDSDLNSQRLFDNVFCLLKDISNKQNVMIHVIKENQKAIKILRQQCISSKKLNCTCSNYP